MSVPGKGYSTRQRKLALLPFVVVIVLFATAYVAHNYFGWEPLGGNDEAESSSVSE